jgi:hypothetical protein
VIANVPPHWNEGVKEDHGSRWAGQVIWLHCFATAFSRVVVVLTGHRGCAYA